MAPTHNLQSWLKILQDHQFSYDLGIKVLQSNYQNAQVTICAHGYGHSNKIADVVKSFNVLNDHIIGFNFPDYQINEQANPAHIHFGTIDEILPLLYVLKRCAVDLQIPVINLYGFSAGGGAVINALAVLTQNRYNQDLQKIGIGQDEKQLIITALQKGMVILDCPLKSLEEIIAARGADPLLNRIADNYARNEMRPIDSVNALSGMQLNIVLHFQNPDEILGNRDDAVFAEQLRAANSGQTTVVIGSDGGHNSFHASLWREYKKLKNSGE